MKKLLTLTLLAMLVGVNAQADNIVYVTLENDWSTPYVWSWHSGQSDGSLYENTGTTELAGRTWYTFNISDKTEFLVKNTKDSWDKQTGNITGISNGNYYSVLGTTYDDNGTKYNVVRRNYTYPRFFNNIIGGGTWSDNDNNLATVKDAFTFTYTLTKENIASTSPIYFRFKAGYDSTWPEYGPTTDSNENIARGSFTTNTRDMSALGEKNISYQVDIPSYNYDEITLYAKYVYVDGEWKWKIGANVNALVKISSYGVSTYSCEDALDFSVVSGITPYKGKVADNTATFTEITTAVPANTGLLVKGTAGETYTVPVVAEGTAVSDNELLPGTGTSVNGTDGDNKNLVLMAPEGNLGFYLPTGSFTVGKNTAYLHTAASNITNESGAKVAINFGDETGIFGVSNVNRNDNVYYDLQGRRVENPTKGLFIVNGKKVVL